MCLYFYIDHKMRKIYTLKRWHKIKILAQNFLGNFWWTTQDADVARALLLWWLSPVDFLPFSFYYCKVLERAVKKMLTMRYGFNMEKWISIKGKKNLCWTFTAYIQWTKIIVWYSSLVAYIRVLYSNLYLKYFSK